MLKRDYGKYLVDLTRQHKRFHQAYTRMWTQPDDEGPWIGEFLKQTKTGLEKEMQW